MCVQFIAIDTCSVACGLGDLVRTVTGLWARAFEKKLACDKKKPWG